MPAGRKSRLAVVISHPIQHFAPLFRALTKRPEIELRVFYCCDWGVQAYEDKDFGATIQWNIPLLQGYDSEFLPIRRRPRKLGFFDIDNPAVNARLSEFGPDAVWVHGYGHRTSWRVLRWAQRRARVLYFGDSELLSRRGRLATIIKRLLLPRFFRRCDGFLTIGDHNEAYYRLYGVPPERMHRAAFPVDIDRFQSTVAQAGAESRKAWRVKLGLRDDAIVLLFVGKMIPIKRPLDVIEAIRLLQPRIPNVQALMVGSGPLEAACRDRVRQLGLENAVRFAGFVNQHEIPLVLACGDILAMCSEKDPHPLAVTECMAVGNAIIASDRVGCVGPTDSARENVNTLVYPCGDVIALADCVSALALQPERLQALRAASLALSWTQDVSVTVRGVLQAMQLQTCS